MWLSAGDGLVSILFLQLQISEFIINPRRKAVFTLDVLFDVSEPR